MQQVWLALIGGLILGWLIEWIIDWQFWRRNLDELRTENQVLHRRLSEAQAQLAALSSAQPVSPPVSPTVSPIESAPAPLATAGDLPGEAREEADARGAAAAPADSQTEGE